MKKRIAYTSIFISTLCFFQAQLFTKNEPGLLIEVIQEPYGSILVSDGQKKQQINEASPATIDNYENTSITVHQNWKDFGWRKLKRDNYVELKISNKSPNLNYMIFLLEKNCIYPVLKPSEGPLKTEESKNIIIKPKYGNTTFLVEPTIESLRKALDITSPKRNPSRKVIANEEEIDTLLRETILFDEGVDSNNIYSSPKSHHQSTGSKSLSSSELVSDQKDLSPKVPKKYNRPGSMKMHGYNLPDNLDTPQPEGSVPEVYKRKGSVLRDHGYNVPSYMDEPEDYESIDE